ITLEHGVRFVMECTQQMHGGEIFVPKIPSGRIMDLTEAIAPGCKVDYIGIRGGEKLHEVLVSEDEARHTLELEDKYIIMPSHPWWRMENWSGFDKMTEGSSYSSDANAEWLSVEALRRFAREGE
ncbi:MAG TPA: polysaccharide biosynthesis protein, partial [Methanothrix sp.]|nr:polysaccharide biosynthesis protein [Methanothrix sp.]